MFWTPNRTGLLAEDPRGLAARPHLFVLDMFPYPSGVGLHVGHPLGFIATDVYARFQRMNGFNVLHSMGYDAFGLPAEQFAVQTGTHPRVTTEQNIETMKRQMRALGLAHDPRRGPATTDPGYYRWTQWIFLQIYNSWYDDEANEARTVEELVQEFRGGRFPTPDDIPFDDLGPLEQRRLVDCVPSRLRRGSAGQLVSGPRHRARQRGGNRRRPERARQLPGVPPAAEAVDAAHHRLRRPPARPTSTTSTGRSRSSCMQRNWIGRSTGASVRFPVEGQEDVEIEVFTTRPDTLFGATYMVLAPEHPLVDVITSPEWPGDDLVQRLGEQPDRLVEGRVRPHRSAARGGAPLPRVRAAARPTSNARPRARAGEDRRVHRRVRDQPDEQRPHPDLRRRLRADGLRDRRDHGRARARPTRLRVRARVRSSRSSP